MITPWERSAVLFRARMVDIIRDNPTISQRELARRTNRPKNTIDRHMGRLGELGIVVLGAGRRWEVRTDEA